MKITQFIKWIATVAAGLTATVALADEPRSYETYDDIGLVYFEDIKPMSKDVKTAWFVFRSGLYSTAYSKFEKLVLADKFDDQAILGLVASAKQLGTTSVLLKKCQRLFAQSTNRDLYASNLIKALVKWTPDVEAKGDGDVGHFLEYARGANPNGLLAKLRMAMMPGTPKEKRKTWDSLCAQFPKSEGLFLYRCKTYVNGNIGEGYVDPVTHKMVNTVDPENYPKPDIALRILRPFLDTPRIPTWAAYSASFAYHRLGQDSKAIVYHNILKTAAQSGKSVYVRWNTNVEKVLKLKN